MHDDLKVVASMKGKSMTSIFHDGLLTISEMHIGQVMYLYKEMCETYSPHYAANAVSATYHTEDNREAFAKAFAIGINFELKAWQLWSLCVYAGMYYA
jgi:hypothetical protein